MSDMYSVPSLPEKTAKKATPAKYVNANAVFQSILQQLDAEERKDVVLRCDEMPLLDGDEGDIKNLFAGLLQLILQQRKAVSRLFLHIHCTAAETDTPAKGWQPHTIQFHTNIIPQADWRRTSAQALNDITILVEKINGSLEISEGQGCFFALSLPGKPV